MNKGKLRSLMFHAGFCNEDGGWDNRPIWEQEHDNFQRFAELIVRECADVAKETRWAVPPSQEQIAKCIQQHFGVGE